MVRRAEQSCSRLYPAEFKIYEAGTAGSAPAMEAHAALQSLQGQEPFDCIFMDPPYDKGLEKDVLYAFRDASFIGEDTLIIVEASLNTDFDWAEDAGYEILKKKIYKTNVHVFLTPKSKHEGVKES